MSFDYTNIELGKQLDPCYLSLLVDKIKSEVYTRNIAVSLSDKNIIQIDVNGLISPDMTWSIISKLSSQYYEQLMMLDKPVLLFDSEDTSEGTHAFSPTGGYFIIKSRITPDAYAKGRAFGMLVSLVGNKKYTAPWGEVSIPGVHLFPAKVDPSKAFAQGCLDFLKPRNELHYLDQCTYFRWSSNRLESIIHRSKTCTSKAFELVASYENPEPNVF